MTTATAAEKWGLTASRILKLAKGGRIPGTVQIGTRWMIPANAEKPADARTRAGKAEKAMQPDTFRYPLFAYKDLESFSPPLNEEELQMKAVEEAFYACRFREADRLLGNLPEKTKDRYRRISTLHEGCMIDITLCNTERFFRRYGRLQAELEENFPHKEEMKEYIYELDATLGADDYYVNRFRVIPGYAYHESFLPQLTMLSAVSLSLPNEKRTPADLNSFEVNCILLQNSGAYPELQSLHVYLASAYVMLGMETEGLIHFRKALELAEKFQLYYPIAMQYYYMPKPMKAAFSDFPEELKQRIVKLSEDMHRGYIRFMDAISMNSIYKLLANKDYIFLYYAVQGMAYKDIANRLHMSVSTVGKRFGEIYAIIGVKNKIELVELYKQSVGETVLREKGQKFLESQ